MSTAWLCQIDAFARVGGAATTIRLASHDDDRLCHLNAQTWWPAIARLPTLAYDFFDGAFGGEIVTPSGRADLSIEAVPGFAALMLHGARIRWYSGTLGGAWGEYVLRFDGLIDNHPAIRDGVAAVDFRVDDRWLDDPILATYAGTTGAEGEAALKGQVKPLLLGAPRFVEGVLVDSIDTIIQLNDGAIAGVDVGFESVARFAPSAGDYASFAALDAATIAPGFYATCLAGGYVRHGAPPDGALTYHVQGSNAGGDGGGQVRRAGAMIKRIAARLGHSAKVDAAGLTAIDSARPWDLSVPLTSQTTLRELAQSLAQSINAVALVTWTGLLTMLPIDPPEGATPVGTLASDGTALPPVARVDQLGIAPPWWRTAIEADVTHRVHGYDEVRFTANLVEVGIYDSGTTYREGNIASIADGSRWLYTSATPTAGNAPSDVSAYWARWSEAVAGPPGADGADGISNAVVYLYRRAATSPAAPSGTFTYTFATGVLSGGTLNSWTQAVPAADGNPLWVIAATASASAATDTIAAAEFSSPVIKDGAGLNAATVFLYQRAASAPSVPGVTLTYTFATAALAGTLGSWSQAAPAHDGNPLYMITATAVGTGTTDTVATGEWSTPRVIASNGANGTNGTNGAPGTNGTNGITYYTWYAYADAPDGSFNFTTGSPGTRVYQGIATGKTTPTESTTASDYVWSQYVGPPNFGLAVTANAILAGSKLISTSAVSGWNGGIHSTESYKGGASVSFVVDAGPHSFMVGLNTDPTTDASYISLDFAIYIAGTTLQVYQSNSVAFSQASFVALNDVFSIKYDGKSVIYSKNGAPFFTNSSPAPDLTLFLDTSFNSGGVHLGTILSFAAAGPAGVDGAAGLNNAVVYLYRRAASSPSAPSGTFTYTFATGALSGGTLNSWTQAVPAADGNPLWVIAATASANTATDSIAAAEFSSPVIKDGAGLNAATVVLYQRAASAPSVPGSTLTYTFASGVLSGTLGSWTQAVPAHNGNPLYIITATALGTGTTDTIATGEWSTPQILAANGANGANGSNGATGATGATGNKTVRVYRRSGSAPSTPTGSVPPSSWSTSIPADDGTAVWASDVETLANGTTVVGSYTTPVLFQAATPVAGNTTIVLDDGSYGSPAITRFIPNGGSIPVSARLRTLLAAGSGTQYMRLEWRVRGGSWATLGTEGSGVYIPGEFAVISQFQTFTNSSGADQNYEFRAFTRYTGSYAGVEESRSHLTA